MKIIFADRFSTLLPLWQYTCKNDHKRAQRALLRWIKRFLKSINQNDTLLLLSFWIGAIRFWLFFDRLINSILSLSLEVNLLDFG